ncbi:MAG: branched-chain amino acid ABC transporter substrate-binding protein [Actinomycetota bacterium]
MRATRRLVVGTVAAVLAAGCTSTGSTTSGTTGGGGGDAIKIVLEGPITGDQGATGTDMLYAAQLAVEQANADGGVLDQQVELIEADDQALTGKGVQLAKELATDDVFAVVGPYNSSVGVKNLPIWIDGGVIPIHLTSNADTDGMGYTVQPKDYQVAPVEVPALSDWLEAGSVAIVYDTSTYTADIAKQVKDDLEKAGVEVPLFEGFKTDRLDAGKVVDAIAATDADYFYSSTYFPEGGQIAKAAHRVLDQDCFMGLANQDAGFVKEAGSAAAQECYVSGVPSAEQFPEAKQYVADYREEFGRDPGTWGTFTYDSVNLLFDAVRRAGAWDKQKLMDELSATKGYEGLTGPITIDPKTGNRVVLPIVILKVDAKGDFVVDRSWAKFAGFEI